MKIEDNKIVVGQFGGFVIRLIKVVVSGILASKTTSWLMITILNLLNLYQYI